MKALLTVRHYNPRYYRWENEVVREVEVERVIKQYVWAEGKRFYRKDGHCSENTGLYEYKLELRAEESGGTKTDSRRTPHTRLYKRI